MENIKKPVSILSGYNLNAKSFTPTFAASNVVWLMTSDKYNRISTFTWHDYALEKNLLRKILHDDDASPIVNQLRDEVRLLRRANLLLKLRTEKFDNFYLVVRDALIVLFETLNTLSSQCGGTSPS